MKKFLVFLLSIIFFSPVMALAFPPSAMPPIRTTDCSAFTIDGIMCYDTDDDKLYIGNGTAATEIMNATGGTFTGDVNIGSASAGKNLSLYATLGSELAPALTEGNWTIGAGWQNPIVGPGLIKNADGTGTQTPSAATTIVVGTTYKVVITLSALTVGSASYTIGGITGTSLIAATTYTDYITAKTTGKLIITPTSTSRFTISAISIKALTNATGDLTVDGNLTVNSPITFNSAIIAPSPHHAFGIGSTLGNIGIRVTNNFISDGVSTFAAGMDIDPTITMAAGDTSYGTYVNIAGFGITTQPAEVVGVVSGLRLAEPNITVGAAGTVSVAATLYLDGAPTEGAVNAAMYVNAGDVYFNSGNFTMAASDSKVGIAVVAPWESLSLGYNKKISLGQSTLYNFNIYKSSGGYLDTFFDSLDDDANTDINFRMRTGGTAIDALTIKGTGYIGIGTDTPLNKLGLWNGSLDISNSATVGSESLNETSFATHADWDVTGDFTDTGGNAAYLHNTGAGTLTQTSGNLAIALKGSRWYKLTYTVSGVVGTPTATIPATVATSATSLSISNGVAKVVYFKTIATPTDFIINGASTTATHAFVLDDLSLKEIKGGDAYIGGYLQLGNPNTTVTNDYVVAGGQAATTHNTGWLPVYVDGVLSWIPYWSNATP